MNKISKYKVDISIIICIILFCIISVITIKSAEVLIGENTNLVLKQILWYIVGFLIIGFIMFIGNQFLYKNALKILYKKGFKFYENYFNYCLGKND